MKHEKALKTLAHSSKMKPLVDWLVELSPHEEFVLRHMLLQGNKRSSLFGDRLRHKQDKDVKAFSTHLAKHGKHATAHHIQERGGANLGAALKTAVRFTGKVGKKVVSGVVSGAKKVAKFLGKHHQAILSGAGTTMQTVMPILAATGNLDPETAAILGVVGEGLSESFGKEEKKEEKKPEEKKGGSMAYYYHG